MRKFMLISALAMVVAGCMGPPTYPEGEYTENPMSMLSEPCPEGTVLVEYRSSREMPTQRVYQYCLDTYGVEQGPARDWEDGKTIREGRYAAGKRVGEWTLYGLDGRIEIRTYNDLGERDGIQFGYYPSGDLEYTKEYTRGIQDGLDVWYHENGIVSEIVAFYAGALHGEFMSFNPDGTIRNEREYDHNRLVRCSNSFSIATFVTSNGDGYVENHDPNGYLLSRGPYEKGVMHGCWESFIGTEYPLTTLYHQGKIVKSDCHQS
jgi:antitoxin component YwqK of YwqJK toxin-antitoxin module